nr:phage BR0599 family protein [Aureimonas sp. Leaf324]
MAGCDWSFTTCRERFGNGLNFRGFPHIPGADAALAVAKSDARHDGSAVVP